MHWIAPSEKDTDNAALEKRLWDAGMKCEGRSSSCEVQLVRHSSFVVRHWHGLPAEARFDYLLNRPEAENIGVAKCEVRVANSEVQSVRQSKFVIRSSPIPASLDYDAFGRIYERAECRIAKCEFRSAASSAVETRQSKFV